MRPRSDSAGVVLVQQPSVWRRERTFLRPTQPLLPSTHLITRAHEYLPQSLFLPGRKHQDACEIVVVPAHLLFAEEAHDLPLRTESTRLCIVAETGIRYLRCGVVRDEEVV